MIPLPSFTVTARPRVVDGSQTGPELVEVVPEGATVAFTSNVPTDAFLVWDGRLENIRPVPARLDADGDLVTADGDPVLLLANHPDLGVTGIQWTAVVTVPAGRYRRSLAPIVFDAPGDGGSVNLAAVAAAPVVPAPVEGTPLTIASLLTMVGDNTSGLRAALDDLYLFALIDGGTP